MEKDPIYKAIYALRSELERIDHVIRAVEALSNGKRRRGRPPKFMAGLRTPSDKQTTKK